jgi:hypothetical protein
MGSLGLAVRELARVPGAPAETPGAAGRRIMRPVAVVAPASNSAAGAVEISLEAVVRGGASSPGSERFRAPPGAGAIRHPPR